MFLVITLQEIEKLAELARIKLDAREAEKLRADIGAILEYVAQISEASRAAGAAAGPEEPFNVMRADERPHESGCHTEKLLSAAPAREGQYIRVKKIL